MKRILEFRDSTKGFKNLSGLIEGIFAYSPFGMQVYDSKGHNLFVNQSFKDLFGAVPPPEYCVLKDEQATAAGILPLIQQGFNGKIVQLPISWFNPNDVQQVKVETGRRVAIETTLFPLMDENQRLTNVVFVFKDVTAEQIVREENLRINQRLAESNTQMETFLNNTKAVIYFKDLSGKYLRVNRQYTEVFEVKYENIIGKTDFDLFPLQVAEAFVSADRSVMKNNSHLEIEEEAIHPNGEKHSYISNKFPIKDENGEVSGICGISTDITEIKNVQLELNRSRRLESLGILAGGIAHDFNNSLCIIQLQAETVISQIEDKKAKAQLQTIVDATTRSGALIKQLLAFGRKQEVRPQSTSVQIIIEDLRKMLEQALGESIHLKINYEKNLSNIFADPTQIEQILVNLCINARDAMRLGGTLSIDVKNSILTKGMPGAKIGAAPGAYVEISVRDTGHGINSEIQDKIFEPFFTTKEKDRGNGLGLSSVIGIVEQNAGELVLESKENVGTCFRIFFPQHEGEASAAEVRVRANTKTFQGNELILLIEDHSELREATAHKLRRSGYRVLEASCYLEVKKLLEELAEPVGLIVSDVIMPEKSGPEIVNEISGHPFIKSAKILFVSGHAGNELEKHKINSKDFSFLEKPYNGKQLLNRIEEVLGVRH